MNHKTNTNCPAELPGVITGDFVPSPEAFALAEMLDEHGINDIFLLGSLRLKDPQDREFLAAQMGLVNEGRVAA